MTAWNPGELDQTSLPACHAFFQFFVADGRLSLMMYQRSCDLFLGVPFNMAQYAVLLHLAAQLTGLVPDEFTHVLADAEYGYTANLPLADIVRDESMVVYAFDGDDIEPIHGGPVRLLVPHLYFWKSPKWLRGLELRADDTPGFWEQNGYHNYGDPWREQRYWGD